ncbi:MAG: hypothetical protein U1E38_00300 [Rhodospirillales bacterium]
MRHWLAPGAIAVVEVAAREPLALPPEYALLDERVYGAARLVFVAAGRWRRRYQRSVSRSRLTS